CRLFMRQRLALPGASRCAFAFFEYCFTFFIYRCRRYLPMQGFVSSPAWEEILHQMRDCHTRGMP
ncbi:MAG: hypothetical protein ACTHLV_09045, partial [Achromobacter mucicolens]